MSGSYDLGVVKLGAGYQARKFTGATSTNKQTVLGVSAPYGAFNFGLNYSTNKQLTASNKGIDLGVSYALSMRTNVYAQMQRITVGDTPAAKTTRVKMVTSF